METIRSHGNIGVRGRGERRDMNRHDYYHPSALITCGDDKLVSNRPRDPSTTPRRRRQMGSRNAHSRIIKTAICGPVVDLMIIVQHVYFKTSSAYLTRCIEN
jgi:hypothetical protein